MAGVIALALPFALGGAAVLAGVDTAACACFRLLAMPSNVVGPAAMQPDSALQYCTL